MMPGRKGLGERGDSLVLINTDTNEKIIRILTIPRDTYVYVRGVKTKINHALARGGWQLQKVIIEEFLGIKTDRIFFLDINNLRDIFYVVRQKIGNVDVIKDIYSRLGLIGTAEVTWEKVKDMVTTRKLASAAVGRAKNHAKILAAIIQTLRDYYNDPDKKILFEESTIVQLLGLVKYTDLTPEDVISITNEWSTNKNKIELYYIPGKPERINNMSYWIAKDIPGSEDYFTKVVHYRKSKIA